MVLKLKPVKTKKIVAAPSPVTFEPVSKRTSAKYDDNKIAERIPIEEVSHQTEQFATKPNSSLQNNSASEQLWNIQQSLTQYFS